MYWGQQQFWLGTGVSSSSGYILESAAVLVMKITGKLNNFPLNKQEIIIMIKKYMYFFLWLSSNHDQNVDCFAETKLVIKQRLVRFTHDRDFIFLWSVSVVSVLFVCLFVLYLCDVVYR